MPSDIKRIRIIIGQESELIEHEELTRNEIAEIIYMLFLNEKKGAPESQKDPDKIKKFLLDRTQEIYANISRIANFNLCNPENWKKIDCKNKNWKDQFLKYYFRWAVTIGEYFYKIATKNQSYQEQEQEQEQKDLRINEKDKKGDPTQDPI